jgi:hypothetical protein
MKPFSLSAPESKKFIELATELDVSLDPFLNGTVYSKAPYTEAEQKEIVQELIAIFNKEFKGKSPSQEKTYISTAGAPGVGNS